MLPSFTLTESEHENILQTGTFHITLQTKYKPPKSIVGTIMNNYSFVNGNCSTDQNLEQWRLPIVNYLITRFVSKYVNNLQTNKPTNSSQNITSMILRHYLHSDCAPRDTDVLGNQDVVSGYCRLHRWTRTLLHHMQ